MRGRLPPACAGMAQAGLMVGQMWYVYILKSINKKWYYVGSTNRIEIRIKEHNKGYVKSSRLYRPLKLVFSKKFNSEKEARDYERKIKDCRIEKEKIIRQIENL